jgi:hypothetical protein
MPRQNSFILAVLLTAPIAFVLTYALEFLAADSALDAGASYDYRAGRADFVQGHPFIPFAERHRMFCTLAGCSSLGAVGYGVAVAIWRAKSHAARQGGL